MKQKWKVLLYSCIMIFALFALSACKRGDVMTDEQKLVQEQIYGMLEAELPQFLQSINEMEETQLQQEIKMLEKSGYKEMSAALQNFLDNKKNIGSIISVLGAKASGDEENGYIVSIQVEAELRKAEIRVMWAGNQEVILANGQPSLLSGENFVNSLDGLSVVPAYTMLEKMKNAGLNTLMGMGVVFTILVFISFLISLFKYIRIFEDFLAKKKLKKEVDTAEGTPVFTEIVEAVSEPADDGELIAVITAAIAAYEGENKDGLVVRSIKRVANKRR